MKYKRIALTAGELAKELGVDLATAQDIHDRLVVHGQAAHKDRNLYTTVSGLYVDQYYRPPRRKLPSPNKPW
jgi:hypothetical protein